MLLALMQSFELPPIPGPRDEQQMVCPAILDLFTVGPLGETNGRCGLGAPEPGRSIDPTEVCFNEGADMACRNCDLKAEAPAASVGEAAAHPAASWERALTRIALPTGALVVAVALVANLWRVTRGGHQPTQTADPGPSGREGRGAMLMT